jgi:hypothetical protein
MKKIRKLVLNRVTVRQLTGNDLGGVVGGARRLVEDCSQNPATQCSFGDYSCLGDTQILSRDC